MLSNRHRSLPKPVVNVVVGGGPKLWRDAALNFWGVGRRWNDRPGDGQHGRQVCRAQSACRHLLVGWGAVLRGPLGRMIRSLAAVQRLRGAEIVGDWGQGKRGGWQWGGGVPVGHGWWRQEAVEAVPQGDRVAAAGWLAKAWGGHVGQRARFGVGAREQVGRLLWSCGGWCAAQHQCIPWASVAAAWRGRPVVGRLCGCAASIAAACRCCCPPRRAVALRRAYSAAMCCSVCVREGSVCQHHNDQIHLAT